MKPYAKLGDGYGIKENPGVIPGWSGKGLLAIVQSGFFPFKKVFNVLMDDLPCP
ncbi:hypothetical protein BXY57_0764 [Thermoflavifilum aggregans]|uniref:Uncharacterized protein n=1 Tax=Thermoflavifilum aggregans TaxID=454188 RepID=A0A2M9CTL6_9BACT|nr:hypothetical protein BXY57_0764 [Thermoflavifilum aggregans]